MGSSLFIERPAPDLGAAVGWLENTVARQHSVRHRTWGRLFGSRKRLGAFWPASGLLKRVKICTLTPDARAEKGSG